MPIWQQRKDGVRLDDRTITAFPRLRHPRAELSQTKWRALSPAEKIERQLRMSLDRAAEILCWPLADLDPVRLALFIAELTILISFGGAHGARPSWGARLACPDISRKPKLPTRV
jgi:hypothetical protein